jgi:hypothetical protein
MTVAWPPSGIGWVIAILVLLFAVLMMAGVLPMTPITVGGMIAGLAIARII